MPRLTSTLTVLALALVACSGDDATTTATGVGRPTTTVTGAPGVDTTADPAAPTTILPITGRTDRIGCRVRISGEVTAEFTAKDDSAALSSDYYLSQDELDRALGQAPDAAPGDSTPAGEEPDLTPPPRPEGAAPLVAWFLLNCQGGDITLNVYSDPTSTSDDVPFGAGTYTIAPGTAPADAGAPFTAFIVFGANPEPTNWIVDEDATLRIDRFDRRGAAGSFRIPMTALAPGTGSILVEGEFDVTCQDGDKCQR